MKRLRPRTVALFFAAGLVAGAIAVACSFPDVSFAPDTPQEAGTPDGPVGPGTDSAASDGDTIPSDVDPDGGSEDATTIPDGGGHIEAGADGSCPGAADPCDCDGDKSQHLDAPTCSPSQATTDCDDFNPYIHPDAGFVASTWDPLSKHTPQGDWNCDNTVTKQYPYAVSCSLTSCVDGFVNNPGCGASDVFQHCKVVLGLGGITLCQDNGTDPIGTYTQGCR